MIFVPLVSHNSHHHSYSEIKQGQRVYCNWHNTEVLSIDFHQTNSQVIVEPSGEWFVTVVSINYVTELIVLWVNKILMRLLN